jgi:hypothetical protein
MPRKTKPRTFDETVNHLRSLQFDVREVPAVANRAPAQQVMVSKYDCAAILGRDANGGIALVRKPGVLLGGEIAILLDRGYQKFFKTSRLEVAATADRLKAEHRFTEELDEVIGGIDLYNEALGTVSDEYMYDRVKGRDKDGPPPGLAPWDQSGASTGH